MFEAIQRGGVAAGAGLFIIVPGVRVTEFQAEERRKLGEEIDGSVVPHVIAFGPEGESPGRTDQRRFPGDDESLLQVDAMALGNLVIDTGLELVALVIVAMIAVFVPAERINVD